MSYISVRTAKGRVARTSPRGEYIPTDRYTSVPDTPYIQRLLSYGDLELEPRREKAKEQPAVPATPAMKEPAADKK